MNESPSSRDSDGLSALFDFSFKKFITLSIIKILFILGLGLIAIAWIGFVITGFAQGFVAGVLAMVVGAVIALVYAIFFRIWLELIVVLFRIGENTSILVAQSRAGGASPPPAAAL